MKKDADSFNQNSSTGNTDNARDRSSRGDKIFPGYPHYPSSEDIMNPELGLEKIPESENLTRSGQYIDKKKQDVVGIDNAADTFDDLGIVPGTEADVTEDDLLILGEKEQNMDSGDDELDKTVIIGTIPDEELDVPGSEIDDANEALGEEDEENNYYSIGGDRHDNLEEDPQ